MARLGVLGLLLWALVLAGCSVSPPPSWEAGGAPLALGQARWDRPRHRTVEILEAGNVLQGGREVFFIDRVGRVTDKNREPVGILLPDGFVAGPEGTLLGRVGVSNAAPPDSVSAWLAVMPDGMVVRFDRNGDRKSDGAWTGCEGAMLRTCTLVTHLVAMQKYRDPRQGPSIGIGIGMGF